MSTVQYSEKYKPRPSQEDLAWKGSSKVQLQRFTYEYEPFTKWIDEIRQFQIEVGGEISDEQIISNNWFYKTK